MFMIVVSAITSIAATLLTIAVMASKKVGRASMRLAPLTMLALIGIFSFGVLAGCTPASTQTAPYSSVSSSGSRVSSFAVAPSDQTESYEGKSQENDLQQENMSSETSEPMPKTVVCIGDSITDGNVPTYYESDAWPEFLQALLYSLYDDWTLINLGVTSTTLLDEGVLPYRSTGNIEVAEEIAPDMAIVMLGTNDSCDPHWDADAYQSELRALVDELHTVRADMQIVLMAPPSVFCNPDPYGGGVFHMNDAIIGGQIRSSIRDVASETGSVFVDLYEFTKGHPEWFPDTVHPDGEGNRAIAAFVFDAVFG